jgi:hypothetical protein
MKAAVGDRMVISTAHLDGPVRDGEILSTGGDGGPPYRVRWSDTGWETLFFPGPDAHIQHFGDTPAETTAKHPVESSTAHVKSWRIDLYLYEGQHATSAQAVLHGDTPKGVRSLGVARRRPGDPDIPEVGDDVAVARALRRLSDLLIGAAADDLSGVTGRRIDMTS